ncbi:MAG: site-specific integrase [Desulfobacterales bacterium]|nr:site-specific integrase [Desulfobacterales bacterium]
MPRKKKQLQFHKASKRWAKRYTDPETGKKPFKYLGQATPTRDGKDGVLDELYDLALAKWKSMEAELEARRRANERQQRLEGLSEKQRWAYPFERKVELRHRIEEIEGGESVDEVQRRDEILVRVKNLIHFAKTKEDWLHISEEIAKLDSDEPEVPEDKSLMYWAEQFVAMKQKQVEAGQRSAGRFQEIRTLVNRFVEWMGPQAAIEDINPSAIERYYQHQLSQLGPDYGQNRARDAFQTAKQFIRWLGDRGILTTLPSNLDSKELTFRVPNGRKRHFSPAEIQDLVAKVRGRTRLFILLSLNCGFYPKDIADLAPDEVDWEQGRIYRNRSKTRHHSNAPVVCYKLWPETLKLLKQYGKRTGKRVLMGRGGRPLVYTELRQDGKTVKVNAIGNAFQRFRAKNLVVLGGRAISDFRKTSATWLRNSGTHAHLVGLFLGHAPSSTAERFYAANGDQILDDAIEFLWGEIFQQEINQDAA